MAQFANSTLMYLLAGLVTIFVLATSIAFIFRSYQQAKRIGMDMKIIKKTVMTSTIFSLLPSISILIGVVALSGNLGIPLPWIRLSVIGALHYEQTAVKTAYDVLPILSEMTKQQYVTIATVMTLFILSGPIFCLFAFKVYDKKLVNKAKAGNTEVVEEKKEEAPKKGVAPVKSGMKRKPFGAYLFGAAFIALVSSFLAEDFGKLTYKIGSVDKQGNVRAFSDIYTPTIVALVSFGSMFLFTWIAKKTKKKWIEDFALGFSMLIGMASAVITSLIVK